MNSADELTYIKRVLKIATEFDTVHYRLDWYFDNDFRVSFCVRCNDLFWWGTADVEDILPEDVDFFEQTMRDAREMGMFGVEGVFLYCARKRNMRPQTAAFRKIKKIFWDLFLACGPERKQDVGNPYSFDMLEENMGGK